MKSYLRGIKKYFAFALFLQLSLSCHAQYEIYNAKTVSNNQETNASNSAVEFDEIEDYELPKYSKENSLGGEIAKRTKRTLVKKKNIVNIAEDEITSESIINLENSDDVINMANQEEQINKYSPRDIDNVEVNDNNRFQINADKITYDEEEGNVYAKEHVEIIAQKQKTTLKADDAVLDKASQTIKLNGNVKVIKEGVEMIGEYLVVDLNEQNVLMDNPTVSAYQFDIVAQEGYLIANDIQLINGTIKSSNPVGYSFESGGFARYENIAMDFRKPKHQMDRSNMERSGKQTYKIDAKKIILTSYKDHNSLILKKSNVYYKNHRILFNTDIEIISDKDKKVVDVSSPEAGSLRNFGAYIGYGWVTKMPGGHTLKLMPAVTHGKGKIGAGLIGRYRSQNNLIEAGWNTSTTNLVVKGRYRLTKNLNFKYGRNAYLSEGFLGARRSGYAAQLEYTKSFIIPELKDTRFNHGIYAGFFSDYKKHNLEKAYSTARFRYSAELRKNIFEYRNTEQDLSIKLSAMAQGAATVYGSGQTTGVVRIGPFLTTRVKFWESSLGYMIAGVHGDSPFLFDKYYYGKSTIMLNEKINFGDKFAFGVRAYVTPLKDNYNKKLMTESRIYAMFGPQDLKFVLSYDFVRDIANFDFLFLLGSESSHINFEELITKDIESKKRKTDFYKNAKRVKIVEPENI